MNGVHRGLADGRWQAFSFLAQMANIGSEVERALSWRAKANDAYSRQALARALELIDLTLSTTQTFSRLKELARVREAVADYFIGVNEFQSTPEGFSKYFLQFAIARTNNR